MLDRYLSAHRIWNLPTHPRTGLRAVGVVAGKPVWPILGGSGEGDPPAPTPSAPPTAPAPLPAAPAYTPPATQADLDRILGQRLNQERSKFGGLTGDEFAAMKTELDTLKAATGTDLERAVKDAKTAASKDAEAKFLPMLAQARIEGAANGRVSADALTKALEYTDLSKFISNGQVDTAKVTEFVNSIAPAAAPQQSPAPRGPVVPGHNPGGPAPVKPGDSARAYLARQGIKVD